jgi:hypothetical protein
MIAAAMAIPDEGMNLTGQQIDAGQQCRSACIHGRALRRIVRGGETERIY